MATMSEEDRAYKAGYEDTGYRADLWGERLKAAYHVGVSDRRQGYAPNCRIAVDEDAKGCGWRNFA